MFAWVVSNEKNSPFTPCLHGVKGEFFSLETTAQNTASSASPFVNTFEKR